MYSIKKYRIQAPIVPSESQYRNLNETPAF